MRIRSAGPFWPTKNGLISNYPALQRDVSCDVAIVGGGICGSMMAYHLAEAGVDTIVLDKRDIGYGSTSASTALVMYEIDMHLTDLIELRGEKPAVRSYKLCLESIGKIERIMNKVGGDYGFKRKKSLYLAGNDREAAILEKEYQVRRRHGFKLNYLNREDIERHFSFTRPGALLSRDAAEVDPYLMTHLLLDYCRRSRVKTFDRTAVVGFEPTSGGALLSTDRGFDVRAKKVVFATGYETSQFLKRDVVKLKSTYAIVSEPTTGFDGWGYDRCLIWEAKRPYFYLRTTRDKRIMMGGEDEEFVNPTRRDRLIPTKASALLRKAQSVLPRINIEIAYAWAGTFGETIDSLPYVGEVEEFPNAYFALCYGANGTNFAVMAAEIIRDLYLKRPNPDAELFKFDR